MNSAAAPPPNPGEKPRPTHTHPKEGMRPSGLARKEFRWWEVTQRSHPENGETAAGQAAIGQFEKPRY